MKWTTLAALFVLVAAIHGCTYDYDAAFTATSAGGASASSASSSAGGHGGGGQGGASSSAISSSAMSSSAMSSSAMSSATSSSTGGPMCAGGDYGLASTGHCYRILTPRTWDQARMQCQAIAQYPMHLAALSGSELMELNAMGVPSMASWVGGHRMGQTTTFYWVDGEPFQNQPLWYNGADANDATGGKNCVTALPTNQLGLHPCSDVLPAICET